MIALKLKSYQISVPFTKEEWDQMNKYLTKEGLKKGVFARKAILNELGRQESQT